MMYVHFCKTCDRFHLLNGHKLNCPACSGTLYEMRMPYMEYVNMSADERKQLIEECHDTDTLQCLSTTYRMYRYSKWYRRQMQQDTSVLS